MDRRTAAILRLRGLAERLRLHAPLGLQGRTTILLLAVLFTASLGTALIQIARMENSVRVAQLRRADDLATVLAAAAAPLFATNDRAALAQLCRISREQYPGLQLAFVTYAGDRIEAPPAETLPDRLSHPAGGPPHSSTNCAPRLFRDPRTRSLLAEVCRPVPRMSPDGFAGTPTEAPGRIHLRLDVSAAREAAHHMERHLLRLMAAVWLLITPITFLIVRRIVHPIREMAEAAKRFARDDLSPRVRVSGSDEVADLARALNTMADGLTASRSELLAFNAELGRQIEQRTRELRDLAARDPLTNLYNRRHFGEVLHREFAAAVRYHEDLSVLMVDLDNFKGINDTHGHHVGDDVLILTAGVIRDELRSADIAARYGGDEFIALLPHTPDADAEALAARIRQELRERAARSLPGVPVDVSVGIAGLKTTEALSPELLVREVDKALYAVKRSGKGRIARAPARPPKRHTCPTENGTTSPR